MTWVILGIIGIPLMLLLFVQFAISVLVLVGEYASVHDDPYVQKLKKEGKW